jgi:CRISPR-associated endonuclease/helicase Cas3
MLVTFISECEKKALKRTRRVLDAFANRIGNNTWQTPITEEGLDAIKKLLKKTASKNTAVSCHQLKSRIRTELLWVVGKREKFNSEGIVAVNYTEQDKFIGEINMSEIYANTKKQPLDQHLFSVGVVAQEMMKNFCTDKQLHKAAFTAGCWHDIGKLEVYFQDWLNKELKKKNLSAELPENGVHIDGGREFANFSWEKYPTHNEVSTLIYELLAETMLGKPEEKAIKHAIYWHHAKPIRKDEINSLTQVLGKLKDNKLKELLDQSQRIMQSVDNLTNNYFEIKPIGIKQASNYEDEIDGIKLPEYKTYETADNIKSYQKQITKNSKENLIRAAVITADRLISSLSSCKLKNYINNKELENFAKEQLIQERGLNQHIKTCLDSFDNMENSDKDRNTQQKQVSGKLADKEIDIAVLKGPAGCGKTKIALEWALNVSAKQILWICPRVAICQSLFNDFQSDEYLPNATIEIHTGEFKYTNKYKTDREKERFKSNTQAHFQGDIVLTTIDQIINGITTYKNISTLTRFMNATVVFDEFHEYAPMAGFNILFAELIKCKKLQQSIETIPSTLLVSATPNYYFVKDFLDISEDGIEGIQSFNDKKYQIEFVDYDESLEDKSNPLYKKVDKNTFVISNTATTAQKSFIVNQEKENGLLTHSKFTPKDRVDIFEKVIDSFKENGSHKFDVLRSGPIIQAALNISCKNMISEMCPAENILQRLGRLNRFAEFDTATLTIALTENINSGRLIGVANFLNRNSQWKSTKVWIEFLKNKTEGSKEITITDLYSWYQEFYETDNYIEVIKEDFISSLKDSVQMIEGNIFEPKRIKLSKDSANRIKKYSLRGNSRFVKMAIYDVKTKHVLNKYLDIDMTLSVDEITGYGGTRSDLLNFMKGKHHNLVGGPNLTRTPDNTIKNNARDPEEPIYVSYLPQELEGINCSAATDAIYYLKGIKQDIGIMVISKLKNDK